MNREYLRDLLVEHIEQGTALDLGHDHWLTFYGWSPDRDLNPQYADVADIPRAGAMIYHNNPLGKLCVSSVLFDIAAPMLNRRTAWTVESWEPLTLSPSLLCKAPLHDGDFKGPSCDDHGFIRAGRWVVA